MPLPIVAAGITAGLAWFAKSTALKFVALATLSTVVILLYNYLIDVLDLDSKTSALSAAWAQIPMSDFMTWILGMINVGEGLSIILSAYALRFLIRRLPVIG